MVQPKMVKSQQVNRVANWLDYETIAPWVFLAPALILLSLFLLYPIVYLIYLSFTQGSFTRVGIHWVGWRNYERLVTSADFWQVLGNTVYFTLASLIPSLLIPLGLAIALKQVPCQGILRTAYFIPSITSMVAVGLGFRWLFQNEGPVNAVLEAIGAPAIDWLASTTWAMPVLILLSTWKQMGFNLVVLLAGLQTIPLSRYEAAQLDGANAWQLFRHITLPGLQPTLIFAIVTTTIFTLRSFEPVYLITGGGPMNSTNLLVYYIYDQAFAQLDFGYAGAGAGVLLAIALLLVYCQLRITSD
ncbi:MAG: sugar ABC transporter permease [Synechococcales bacterium]|nr:sugar ABC transporter permease [Synechococcales bacterium]